jgi:ubiquinone/menaquinone biosynthesis C-methylase UbiE
MKRPYICPAFFAGSLDNFFRKLVQDPNKILIPYVREGMTVLDLGCGPGYFSVELAKLVGEAGKLIAADLQEGMLEKLKKKIINTDLEKRIELHKCMETTTGIKQRVDFILAFWMIHEVPDHDRFFSELKDLLKPDGKILVAEPKIHVTGIAFEKMLSVVKMTGFEIAAGPKAFFSRSVVLSL